MFENSGAKIQAFGKVFFFLIAIGSVITGIWLAVEFEEGWPLLIGLGGVIVSYVSSIMIVGFGELVENSTAILKWSSSNHEGIENVASEIVKLEEMQGKLINAINAQKSDTAPIVPDDYNDLPDM